jgi:hypothetical protein
MVTIYKTKEDEFMADYRDHNEASVYTDIMVFFGFSSAAAAVIYTLCVYFFAN